MIKTYYNFKILNDGSTCFIRSYPWKVRILFNKKDITLHPLWNLNTSENLLQSQTSHFERQIKKIRRNKGQVLNSIENK